MNRKAQSEVARKSVYWMLAGVVITIVVFAFAFVLASYKGKLTQVSPNLKAELLALRFSNSAECFAYQDFNTGRVQSGIIDINKFNEQQLFDCYHTGEHKGIKTFNFRLKLETSGEEITTDKYFNLDKFTIFKEVLVKKNHGLYKDRLVIYVQEKVGK